MPTTLPVRRRPAAESHLDSGDLTTMLGNIAVLIVLLVGLISSVWFDPLEFAGAEHSLALLSP
jgi:hypothetical protein